MIILGWLIVDEVGHDPMATRKESAWAWVHKSKDRHEMVVRTCADLDRIEIPVEVVQALLDVAKRRLKP